MALSNDDIRELMPSDSIELDTKEVRDISGEVLGDDGRMKILPAEYWASTTMQERALFGHRNGIYLFPTTELVERLKEIIGDRHAIEIGAGNGVLAQALGIPATDNRQQEMPLYKLVYTATRQPPVKYGPNIIEMHASRAVRHYKPAVVIGSWITQKYDPLNHDAGGNEIGVDQRDVLLHCQEYVIIGNEHTHRLNPLWNREHRIEFPPYVYSRANNGSREFIARWRGVTRSTPKRRS